MLRILYNLLEKINGEKGSVRLVPYCICQRMKVWLLININY